MPLEQMYETVFLRCPEPLHNNYGLEVLTKDTGKVVRFVEECLVRFYELRETGIDLREFHQGMDSDWYYFELWNGDNHQDEVVRIGEEVAAVLQFKFDIR